jgi:hypothetical protein
VCIVIHLTFIHSRSFHVPLCNCHYIDVVISDGFAHVMLLAAKCALPYICSPVMSYTASQVSLMHGLIVINA